MLQVGKTYDSVSLQNDLDAITHWSVQSSHKSENVHLSFKSKITTTYSTAISYWIL